MAGFQKSKFEQRFFLKAFGTSLTVAPAEPKIVILADAAEMVTG
jgi:hypothetical protein